MFFNLSFEGGQIRTAFSMFYLTVNDSQLPTGQHFEQSTKNKTNQKTKKKKKKKISKADAESRVTVGEVEPTVTGSQVTANKQTNIHIYIYTCKL